MAIKARCSFKKNETNLGRTRFPSQAIWKKWIIQEKKGSQRKKKEKGKAVTSRKKNQLFSYESSYHCSESKPLALIGTHSPAESQEDYSRLKLAGFPDLLSRSSWLEHNTLLIEQSREISPISSLVKIPSVCQFWHRKQNQKLSLWFCLFIWSCIYLI